MKKKIGMYDSGVGGLSVVGAVLEEIKDAGIIYLADNVHVPYGEKSFDEVANFSLGICDFLVKKDVGIIVIACNMSSAISLEILRKKYKDIIILGMIEFGAKAAVISSENFPIGVLATEGTVKSKAYTKFIHSLKPNSLVIEEACPEFVLLVENCKIHTKEAEETVKKHLEPIVKNNCKTVILGCTHYPFLKDIIKKVAPDLEIIDPALLLAKHLKEKFLENISENREMLCFATGSSSQFKKTGSILFSGKNIKKVEKATWIENYLK